MGKEIDLLINYPKTKRDTQGRNLDKTDEVRRIARMFGQEFFDGDRLYGYGGFHYHPRFWEKVVLDLQDYFGITAESSILDVGCAKGFMLYDMHRLIPGVTLTGIDVSQYAIENAKPEMQPFLKVASADSLPFDDNSFDVVLSINTIHNLERKSCIQALQEIERVGRGKSFITVDAYRDENEKKRMFDWNLTARTILHVDEWVQLFGEAGYTGDYYWFIP